MTVLTTAHICPSLKPFLSTRPSDTPKANSTGVKRAIGICPTLQSRPESQSQAPFLGNRGSYP